MTRAPHPSTHSTSLPLAEHAGAPVAKGLRSDGLEARTRLLDAAIELFAEKGFANTSTREIAAAAQVNIASISYYFGDKAGLYKAVFVEPGADQPQHVAPTDMDLAASLRALIYGFTEPLKQGPRMQSCMKLHFREMLEPTGVWQEEIDHNIKPAHMALVQVLCRHLGLKQADDGVHRLAFSLAGLGFMLYVGTDVFKAIRPDVIASAQAIDDYAEQLVVFAQAMVAAEAQRRVKVSKPRAVSARIPKKI